MKGDHCEADLLRLLLPKLTRHVTGSSECRTVRYENREMRTQSVWLNRKNRTQEAFNILGYVFIFLPLGVRVFSIKIGCQTGWFFSFGYPSHDEKGNKWFMECLLLSRLRGFLPQIVFTGHTLLRRTPLHSVGICCVAITCTVLLKMLRMHQKPKPIT